MHSADVRGLAVSSSGQIATTSRDKTIAIWPSSLSTPVATLSGHTHFVNAAVFLSETILVSASSDKTLRVWDISSQTCTAVLPGHTASVCALSALPNGNIVSCSWDSSARVWDLAAGKSLAVLKGHDGSVWAACALPDARLVSVGADRTVRVWQPDGAAGPVLPPAHGDVVRDVVPGPNGGFVTVSNDSAIIGWRPSGSAFVESGRLPDLHDGSFVYAVDSMQGERGWMFVSGGEDNSVKVVEGSFGEGGVECVQTVVHPGTVWDVCFCPNGDFVSACSDGVARVFTRDPDAVADAEVLAAFEKAVSERQLNTKVIGGVDVGKLPEAEAALAAPGKKDGENKIVKTSSGVAEVHMWSAAESRWTKVGEVVDNPAGGGGSGEVKGKKYDFVFEVEMGEGGKEEKLGYNRGENPYFAAQRFVEDNDLSPEFLDQIAQFVEQQVPSDALQVIGSGSSDPLTGGSRYVPSGQRQGTTSSRGDPLTGESRYVPGGQTQTNSNRGDPLTGSSRYVPGGSGVPPGKLPPPRKLIPHQNGIVLYKSSDQVEKIQAKLIELNTVFAKSGSDLALTQHEVDVFGGSLMPKLKMRGGALSILEDGECEILEKLLKWPTSHAFAVLDVARLVIAMPSGCAYFFGKRNGVVLEEVLKHMASANASAAVYIMGCRFLCNMFGNRVAGEKARADCESILKRTEAVGRSSNRRARETLGAVLINFAVMLRDSKASVEEKARVIEGGVKLMGGEKDEEVLFRLLIAMGTTICDDLEAAKKGVELGIAEAAANAAPVSARLQQISLEIATIIAS